MVSRIVRCTVNPAKMNEFRTALNEKFVPHIQSQPGFVENIESLDPATGQFTCITVWKTAADVDNYHRGFFQEVAAAITPLCQAGPSVTTLPVENSSVHHVKAGRAAA